MSTSGGRSSLGVSYPGDGFIQATTASTVAYCDGTGRHVKVRANKTAAVLGKTWTSGDSETIVALDANPDVSERYDVLVLRYTVATGAVTLEVVKGTPGAGTPALTQDLSGSGIWEVPISRLKVNYLATVLESYHADDYAPLVNRSGLIFPTIDAVTSGIVTPEQGMHAFLTDRQQNLTRADSTWSMADTESFVDYSSTFELTSGTTPPTKGNSTYTAQYTRQGRLVEVYLRITIGSTFSAGDGTFLFSLPFSPVVTYPGGVWVHDASADVYYAGGATIIAQTNYMLATIGTQNITHNKPFNWDTGDRITATCRFFSGS